jgi:REP element-mobilizing transposase RayT
MISALMLERPVRKRVRLAEFSYRTPGSYFVTICCAQRRRLFDREEAKGVVQECWEELPGHFSGVGLGEFVVMPNHVHGIVTLLSPEPVRARHASPLPGPLPTLGTVVGSFKSAVARRLHELSPPVGAIWQRNSSERVIRDEEELLRVGHYIRDNPVRWEEDPYFVG